MQMKTPQTAGQQSSQWRARLRHALEDRGLKFNVVSDKAGLHSSYVSRAINGDANPSVDTLALICEAAGIKISYLFSEGNNPEIDDLVTRLKDVSEEEGQRILRLLASSI